MWYNNIGLPLWFSGNESACQCRGGGFDPWIGKSPQRRKWQPTQVFLPGKSNGQRSGTGYSPRGHKELDTTIGDQIYILFKKKFFMVKLSSYLKGKPYANYQFKKSYV